MTRPARAQLARERANRDTKLSGPLWNRLWKLAVAQERKQKEKRNG
jgi:hypothetical protein